MGSANPRPCGPGRAACGGQPRGRGRSIRRHLTARGVSRPATLWRLIPLSLQLQGLDWGLLRQHRWPVYPTEAIQGHAHRRREQLRMVHHPQRARVQEGVRTHRILRSGGHEGDRPARRPALRIGYLAAVQPQTARARDRQPGASPRQPAHTMERGAGEIGRVRAQSGSGGM